MTDKKQGDGISRRGFMRRGAGVLGAAGVLAAGHARGEPPSSWCSGVQETPLPASDLSAEIQRIGLSVESLGCP